MHAAAVTAGMGADVQIYDRNLERLRALEIQFGGRVTTCFSSLVAIEERLPEADLVIGAVLIPGAKAPRVISRDHLKGMKRAAVLVDVSIDQGGCFETSRPTTHSDPTYDVGGITHYCVANMPGAVPITSTHALTNATLPYILQLAELDRVADLITDAELLAGLNVCRGRVTCSPVATSLGIPHTPAAEALEPRSRRYVHASSASARLPVAATPRGSSTTRVDLPVTLKAK
jgi:alanine dehydrogenase